MDMRLDPNLDLELDPDIDIAADVGIDVDVGMDMDVDTVFVVRWISYGPLALSKGSEVCPSSVL